jgi:XTP/dITP diphosphohydrolase
VLALVRHADDPLPILCEGLWHGASCSRPAASTVWLRPAVLGAGAQVLQRRTGPADKNQISHRARAMACCASVWA